MHNYSMKYKILASYIKKTIYHCLSQKHSNTNILSLYSLYVNVTSGNYSSTNYTLGIYNNNVKGTININ